MGDLIYVRLRGYNGMLFGVYQNWAHQNPGNHLDVGIAEDGKWQDRWEKLICMPTQQYETSERKVGKIFVLT